MRNIVSVVNKFNYRIAVDVFGQHLGESDASGSLLYLGASAQEEHPDSTSFPSGGRKIYHECSAIGDMLSAIH